MISLYFSAFPEMVILDPLKDFRRIKIHHLSTKPGSFNHSLALTLDCKMDMFFVFVAFPNHIQISYRAIESKQQLNRGVLFC